MTGTAVTLLAQADDLRSGAGAAGCWARGSALLTRMALEAAVSDHLGAVDPALREASMRSRLLVLTAYASPGVVRDAETAWAGLSRACHHHPYELAPTGAELAHLIDAVRRVATALAGTRTAAVRDP